jgi:hypothetical protein
MNRPGNWFISNKSGHLAIWWEPGREISLEIDLPPTTDARDPQSVRAALKAALAELQAVADDKASIAQLAQTA